MKNVTLFAASLMLFCALPTQAAQIREQTYVVGADVDANGRITVTQFDADVPANIADVLAGAVKQWEFVPAKRDGHPVPAHTFIRAKLQAVPNPSGQYNLRVEFMGNGPKFDKTNMSPPYPTDAARAHQQAFVMLDATVQPDGSLTDMTVQRRSRRWPVLDVFRKAVLAAAQHWHATPERVDGQPVATHMHIPVDFTLSGEPLTVEQADILHEAGRKKETTANTETDQAASVLPSDQTVALDSPLQPRTISTTRTVH